jgi:hypothetical protein
MLQAEDDFFHRDAPFQEPPSGSLPRRSTQQMSRMSRKNWDTPLNRLISKPMIRKRQPVVPTA